jgi:hypothetical protein
MLCAVLPSMLCAVLSQALIMSGPGCFRAFTGAVCDSQHNNSLAEPLFGLAQRCLGVNASCTALVGDPGSLLPSDLQARAQLSANLTANQSFVPPDPMLDLVPTTPPADTLLAPVDEIGVVGSGSRRMMLTRGHKGVVGPGR